MLPGFFQVQGFDKAIKGAEISNEMNVLVIIPNLLTSPLSEQLFPL